MKTWFVGRSVYQNLQSADKQLFSLDRLVFLTDDVYAIVHTLFVPELKLSIDNISELPQPLRKLLPRLAIYLFPFATIANQ